MSIRLMLSAMLIATTLSATSTAQVSPRVLRAYRQLQQGAYDDAADSCVKLLDEEDLDGQAVRDATLVLSRAHQAQGEWDKALTAVTERLKGRPDDASLWARRAELAFLRGRTQEARSSVERALKLDDDQLLPRLIKAHLHRETGELDEALEGYRWFVRYYNREQPADAETLLLVAEGSLEYARWKSVSSVFDFVLNTLCPDALKDDPLCWQVSAASGDLLLEKYNRPQALPELKEALRINPRAAQAMVSLGQAALQQHELKPAMQLAERALAINPNLPVALLLAADVRLTDGEPAKALEFVQRALAVNPLDQRILARQAACFLSEDGIPPAADLQRTLTAPGVTEKGSDPFLPHRSASARDGGGLTPFPSTASRFDRLYADLTTRNPKPGPFLTYLGEFLDARRKYAAAEVCFRRAVEVMPQLAAPRTSLGMLALRTGKLDEAQQILDEAFKADPYHVRVYNMRKVIDVLNGHAVIETEHFILRVPEDERLLGEYMADYLEETYAELTELFGFEPPEKTQFEVYGPAKGTSAHQWFSARMVGLPWIQTIGASTGMIVALASPHASPEPFNWARVLRHEFVHIITLQQTDFNIPHWYTEALAVRTEGVVPDVWFDLLLERVPAGETFNLTNIDRGFQQPQGPSDWHMAYCQSWLYARYIAEQYGEEALRGLLDAYGRDLSTAEAIQEVCGMNAARFEQGYRGYLEEYVTEIKRGRRPLPDVLADLDQEDDVIGVLEAAHDPDDPHPAVVEELAKAYVEADRLSDAEKVLSSAVETFPLETRFLKQLAAVLIRSADDTALRPVLEKLADREPDDGVIRKKLTRLAFDAKDWEGTIRWGREATYCNVREAEVHHLLAQAYESLRQWPAAIREYEVTLTLDDTIAEARDGLARVQKRQEHRHE